MLTKFTTKTNWYPLEQSYSLDKSLSIYCKHVSTDANLDVTFNPTGKSVLDFKNNNYSFLFLTNQSKLNDFLKYNISIDTTLYKITGLLANRFINKLVSEDTLFFSLSTTLSLKGIKEFNNSFFIEVLFLNGDSVIISNVQNGVFNIITVDDFDKNIKVIQSHFNPENLTLSQKEKISVNYVYDKNTNNIVFYKKINDETYIIAKSISNSLITTVSDLENLNNLNIFTLVTIPELPGLNSSIDYIWYTTIFNQNNLNINENKSKYNISNNYLANIEFNNESDGILGTNFITLKNQASVSDKLDKVNNISNSFRSYQTIHTGGNREEGYQNINLGYTSNYVMYDFKPDRTTWFRTSERLVKSININDSLFFQNGAIAGLSPQYSDRIWKKVLNDKDGIEGTGQWLCTWLSGGKDDAIWVDRFYNNKTFTALEALSYNTNVDYTPQHTDAYDIGIKDYPSKLVIDSNSLYAYFHWGKETAQQIVNNNGDFIIKDKLDIFKDSGNADSDIIFDEKGDPVYLFNGEQYGKLLIKNTAFSNSNFTLSFFASRKNWVNESSYYVGGNYLDYGVGIFNNVKINPVLHLIDEKKVYFYNEKYEKILDLDLTTLFFSDADSVHSVFYRGVVDNFYVITTRGGIFEFTANGTLVDSFSLLPVNSTKTIVSTSYNYDIGILLDSSNSVYNIDFKTNNFYTVPEKDITNVNGATLNSSLVNNFCIVISFSSRIYRIAGKFPIFKNNNLYFLTNDNLSIKVYDTNTGLTNSYIKNSSQNTIKHFNFNREDETIVLGVSSYTLYDYRGKKYKEIVNNNSSITNLSVGILNLGNTEKVVIQGFKNNFLYFYSKDYTSTKTVLSNYSGRLTYNFTFDNYYQGVLNSLYSLPGYVVKIKLTNIINSEDFIVLNTNILGETLDSGEHHFSLVLDSLNGVFSVYIDGDLYSTKSFAPGKYFYDSRIMQEDIVFGSTPFYGNVLYRDFYKNNSAFNFLPDFNLTNVKLYSKVLSVDELKAEFVARNNTGILSVGIEGSSKNYIDTIFKVFKNQLPGSKSNLINIRINDSLLKDKTLQMTYNNLIIKNLENYLPAHVKVNKIIWEDSKKNTEKMLEGFYNTENTLTYS